MGKRKEAIQILKQARDILSDRLAERVVELREEILEDAEGLSYMGEIDAVHEQIAGRLVHVSQMLSSLPAENVGVSQPQQLKDPPADDWEPIHVTPEPSANAAEVHTMNSLALPAPPMADDAPAAGPSFQTFAMHISIGNLPGASQALAVLCNLPAARAERCAGTFLEHMQVDPHFLEKAKRLRFIVDDANPNNALVLLHECFGLSGIEAIGALQALQSQ